MKNIYRGIRVERKLRDILRQNGYLVIRAAGSGYDTPDLIALKNGRAVIVEVKTTKRDVIYFRREQYNNMKDFFDNGFNVVVAVYRSGEFRFYGFLEIVDTGKRPKLDLSSFHTTDLSIF
ncbi:MAG: hypothetical protein NZ908_00530 [Candidatus Micrarchaeota archaeon]|nr:hypothetical protein [Candidatus Micrarchaeota archaeon]MCX8154547.1 hypothetical protein [Candidatus Micrarchaeota archaeon]